MPSSNKTVVTCGNCLEELEESDVEEYDAVCPYCWTSLLTGGFIQKGEGPDYGDYEQYTDDVTEQRETDLLFEFNTTLCCDEYPEDCDCKFPDQAPTFDVVLNGYLSQLPEFIYDPAGPCAGCCHMWNGGCEPLRTSLHLLYMKDAYTAAGLVDDDSVYLGSIDGCINYTKESVGETYVRQVSIRARRE